jgi:hypothetical protein
MGFLRRLLGTAVEEPTTPNVRVRDVAPDLDVPALPELEDRETPIPEDGYRLDGGPGSTLSASRSTARQSPARPGACAETASTCS